MAAVSAPLLFLVTCCLLLSVSLAQGPGRPGPGGPGGPGRQQARTLLQAVEAVVNLTELQVANAVANLSYVSTLESQMQRASLLASNLTSINQTISDAMTLVSDTMEALSITLSGVPTQLSHAVRMLNNVEGNLNGTSFSDVLGSISLLNGTRTNLTQAMADIDSLEESMD